MNRNFGTLAASLVVAFSFSFSTLALANTNPKDTPTVEFKYIGNYKNQPVFQLDIQSLVKDEYTVTIKDKNGVVLYSDRTEGKNLSRKFQLNTEEIGDEALIVEVRSRSNKQPQVYEINSTTRYVQENFVSKL
jgi:hypothetical protein